MLNVNLWFARNKDEQIVSILEAHEHKEYTCPVCGSNVIPKALSSKKVTPHYAHIDKSKCDSESMLHWWFKNKFIEKGDTFSIKTDELYTYTCESIEVEKTFHLESGDYRPDVIVHTTNGEEIVFEMANTNKKKVQDYIDRWIELDKVIVEVDIKSLTSGDKTFNALYYKGKCYNFNKRDGGYYNTIGKLKERMLYENKYDIDLIKKLDWFWKESVKYKNYNVDIKIIYEHYCLLNKSEKTVIDNIFFKMNCMNILKDIKEYRVQKTKNELIDHRNISSKVKTFTNICNYTYCGYYNGFYLENYLNNSNIFVPFDDIKVAEEFLNNSIFMIENSPIVDMYMKTHENDVINRAVKVFNENNNKLFHIEITSKYDEKFLNHFILTCKVSELIEYIEFPEDILHMNDDEITQYLNEIVSKFKEILIPVRGFKSINKIINKHTYFKLFSYMNAHLYKDTLSQNLTICEIEINKYKNNQTQIYLSFLGKDIYYLKLKEEIQLKTFSDVFCLIKESKLFKNGVSKFTIEDFENIVYTSINYFPLGTCKECNNDYSLSYKQILYFKSKNLELPKRCKSCRKKRKRQKEVN